MTNEDIFYATLMIASLIFDLSLIGNCDSNRKFVLPKLATLQEFRG